MDINLIEKDNRIILKDVKNFEPKHIFECGQCFRWNREEDGSYTGVAYGKVLNVDKEGNDVIFSNTNKEDFEKIWYNYFDLGRDYDEIKLKLSKDETLRKAIEFGEGIRILRQDEWEILISFITSANNRIPMIKRALETLSERYGDFIEEYNGKKYYSFPTAEALNHLSVDDIKSCYTGFRGKYILSAANIVDNREIDIYAIKNVSTEDARKDLILFPGVGPKVADCIMLFSMNKPDAFPIDVWVKRVMEYFYLDEDTKLKDIQKYSQNRFGELAGFAQQYLFYYARELGIGKKK
ncbi:8-oxoguanine DNA glycosylase [Clostridium sp. D2Q-11]|uniref:DNA-(apurinic or apyrimidinic site) lyase n=1 Tax=Anaeromonas frigoriresistens TaxID=2683708 RepID=A0A942UXC0_9FIRM|nr:DNA glycosylase [Anaeromonas frigoriresistens]MBS4538081.1 8-oxoguanine DNA glycosylase [Anaeromonas frigoriresistens]